ncbi:molybdenum cofactor guanylyltransferase [Pseudoteredinibacter isoporae]|uniref:molybdenum cofactor guanylyltransferase n=1 Tax=Pseudoteredinibacter isoporae TaxID=570281 RepID=UPI003108D51B
MIQPNYAQLILCGGEGRRMASAYAQKALAEFHGHPLLSHALSKQQASTEAVLVSCGPKPAHHTEITLRHEAMQALLNDSKVPTETLYDASDLHLGPLAGIFSGLDYCIQQRPYCEHLLVSPVDTPRQAPDLGQQLLAASRQAPKHIIVSECEGRLHPLHSLWPVAAYQSLEDYLSRGERRVMGFIERFGYESLNVPDPDSFQNINSPEDLSS